MQALLWEPETQNDLQIDFDPGTGSFCFCICNNSEKDFLSAVLFVYLIRNKYIRLEFNFYGF